MITYLDHAATTALRPPEVVDAVRRYLGETGATPGRGGHGLALEAGRTVLRARRAVAGSWESRGTRVGSPSVSGNETSSVKSPVSPPQPATRMR